MPPLFGGICIHDAAFCGIVVLAGLEEVTDGCLNAALKGADGGELVLDGRPWQLSMVFWAHRGGC